MARNVRISEPGYGGSGNYAEGLFSTDIGATSFQDDQEAEAWVKDPENSNSYSRRSGGRSV